MGGVMPDPLQAEPQTYPQGASAVKAGRHVLVFINGILTSAGDSEGWTDRAVTWAHLHTDFRAEKLEYFTGPLLRRLTQQARAEKFARMLLRYAKAGYAVSLVGHSNGADLIVRILDLVAGGARVESAHLVAAACEADFERNGINTHLRDGVLGRVQVFASTADKALGFARLTAAPLSLIGLGYGSLGLTGPKNVAAAVRERVSVVDRPGYGHSTWFADEFDASPSVTPRLTPFEETMRQIRAFELFHATA